MTELIEPFNEYGEIIKTDSATIKGLAIISHQLRQISELLTSLLNQQIDRNTTELTGAEAAKELRETTAAFVRQVHNDR